MSTNGACAAMRPARPPFTGRGPLRAIIVMVGWLLVAGVAMILATMVGLLVMRPDPNDVYALGLDYPWVVTNGFIAYAVVLILASLHMGFVVGGGDRRMGLGNVAIQQPRLLLGLTFSGTALCWIIVWLLGITDPLNLSGALESAGADVKPERPWLLPLCRAITLALLVPLAEELFFRGWLWVALRRFWSTPAVMLATALPFWLLHATSDWRFLVALLPSTIALSLIRHYCGSVRAALAGHMLHNAVAVAASILAVALGA